MDYFVLNYGAIDIIVTPDGRPVFLEINPIAEAIADVLLGRSPRRQADSSYS